MQGDDETTATEVETTTAEESTDSEATESTELADDVPPETDPNDDLGCD